MSGPQVGQSANLLLKQLIEATQALTLGYVQDAPQDGKQYSRVNGAWVQVAIPEPVVDGIAATYASLPVTVGTPKVGDAYLVMAGTGVMFVNRHPAGLYIRVANNGNLNDWVYEGDIDSD